MAPRANGPEPQTYQVLSTQFLVLPQPCPPLLSISTLCRRASNHRIGGSHVPSSKDGVAFRLTVAWNRDLRPKLRRHLSRGSQGRSHPSLSRAGSHHKPLAKGQTVKLSSTPNVKHEEHMSTSISSTFVNTFLCVNPPTSDCCNGRFDSNAGHRLFAHKINRSWNSRHHGSNCCRSIIIYIPGKRINYV